MDFLAMLQRMSTNSGSTPTPQPTTDERAGLFNLDWVRAIRNESDWSRFLQKLGIFTAAETEWKDPQTRSNFSRPVRPTDSSKDISLADQFTWGSVVCAGVFIIVFVCVMSACWFHKKRQSMARRQAEHLERRRQEALAPFQIDNSVRTLAATTESMQRPPSYFEVVDVGFELPPSYNEAVIDKTALNGYNNLALNIDEPPPFYEEQKPQGEHSEQETVNNRGNSIPCTITVETITEQRNMCSSA